jgi:hypothetical protein
LFEGRQAKRWFSNLQTARMLPLSFSNFGAVREAGYDPKQRFAVGIDAMRKGHSSAVLAIEAA